MRTTAKYVITPDCFISKASDDSSGTFCSLNAYKSKAIFRSQVQTLIYGRKAPYS